MRELASESSTQTLARTGHHLAQDLWVVGHDVDGRGADDVRSRVVAIVSSLRVDAMVIVHDGTVWELAMIG
jgi:hypothetical protein